ncbi:MAG: C40 family peptidase [Candidatus Zhuqueibacterota bacterium]
MRLQKLERTNRDMSMRGLIHQMRYYLGTPYQYGGADRRGMDCSGFVWKVYQEGMTLELPRSASQMYANCMRIGVKEVRLGDLLFFQSDRDSAVDHVGIFLYKTFFAHTSTNYGVMVSDLKEPYFRSRFIGAGRFSAASTRTGDK